MCSEPAPLCRINTGHLLKHSCIEYAFASGIELVLHRAILKQEITISITLKRRLLVLQVLIMRKVHATILMDLLRGESLRPNILRQPLLQLSPILHFHLPQLNR